MKNDLMLVVIENINSPNKSMNIIIIFAIIIIILLIAGIIFNKRK